MTDVDWRIACESARADANRWQRERDALMIAMLELIALIEHDCESTRVQRAVIRARALCGL
jgi:hypothetical protein